MAKKQTAAASKVGDSAADETAEPARTALEEMEDDAEESLAYELQSALSEVGDGGQVSCQLIKISPKESAGACTTYASGEVNIDRIRDEFGPGVYKIFFRSPQGRIITRKQLSIVAKVTAPVTPVSEIAKLLEQREGAGNNNQNTFLMMMKMMELSSQQMIAAITRPAPLPPPAAAPFGPSEMIAMMTGLATIMKPAREADSPMDAMLKGVKLANELRGDGEGTDWASMLSKGLDAVTPLLASKTLPADVPPQPVAPVSPTRITVTQVNPDVKPPPPSVNEPTYGVETSEENDMLAKLIWMRGQIVRLVEKAKAGKDPALYADLFLDELPSFASLVDVKVAMLDAQWLERLSAINPAVREYAPWFAAFREVIAERIADAEQEAQDTHDAALTNPPSDAPADIAP